MRSSGLRHTATALFRDLGHLTAMAQAAAVASDDQKLRVRIGFALIRLQIASCLFAIG